MKHNSIRQAKASAKVRMIRHIAHKTKPSRCRFIVNLCSALRFKSLTLPAATLLPGLLTTGGAPKHKAECAKIRLSHQKVRKRGLVGACRAPAKCTKCCGSSSVSLMRRKKTSLYSRNTKRFSEKQLDRATRQETVIRNNGTDNFQTHFMLVSRSLPAPGTMSSPY